MVILPSEYSTSLVSKQIVNTVCYINKVLIDIIHCCAVALRNALEQNMLHFFKGYEGGYFVDFFFYDYCADVCFFYHVF